MRAIVFDLDGTLIDSLPDIAAAVNHVLANRGLAPLPPDEMKGMVGDGAKVLLSLAFAARGGLAGEAEMALFMDYYTAHGSDETRPYPGMVEALGVLQAAGHMMAVCTNKPEAAARKILAELGLAPYFNVIIGGDSTCYRKPDPRHLLAVLETLGTQEAVMIGDHDNDVQAATGCGIPAIFAAWGYGLAESDYVAQTAAELPDLIAAILIAATKG